MKNYLLKLTTACLFTIVLLLSFSASKSQVHTNLPASNLENIPLASSAMELDGTKDVKFVTNADSSRSVMFTANDGKKIIAPVLQLIPDAKEYNAGTAPFKDVYYMQVKGEDAQLGWLKVTIRANTLTINSLTFTPDIVAKGEVKDMTEMANKANAIMNSIKPQGQGR